LTAFGFLRYPTLPVVSVMVQPQRGQREELPAQLVPQEEQVLVQLEQPLLQVEVLPRLFTQAPLYVLQEQVSVEGAAGTVF